MLNVSAMTAVEAPKTFDQSEYDKTPARKAAKREYQHSRSKWQTDAKYLARNIVAIDGEGVTIDNGTHLYTLLAASGAGDIRDDKGLGTEQILTYLWTMLEPADLNVIYGGSYDFNMWLRDGILNWSPDPEETLHELYRGNYMRGGVQIGSFKVKWMPGKEFSITKGKRTVVINDVISFFQTSFINACDQYLGEYEGRDELVRQKARRGDFVTEEAEDVAHYNQLELRLLVELVTELRARLNKVGLRPRRWNSPGAIAAALFAREGVKAHLGVVPDKPAKAARFAYAGGRFEPLKYGAVKTRVYEYDINSAYPTALTKLPSLENAKWTHHNGDIGYHEFALYKVEYHGTNSAIPGPLFCRASNGSVSYPLNVTGWYWTPEIEALRKYCEQVPGATFKVLEAWSCKPATFDKPFAFVNKLYAERQNLKAAGDGAQLACKLALNSLYGKLAQQVGWIPATPNNPMRLPPFHKLEWAGYVTSWTRAKILEAALLAPDKIIAFETDALFSEVPLDLPVGKGLGAWEVTEFVSLTSVQSGHYYGTLADGTEVVKCRGIDKGFIDRKAVEKRMTRPADRRTLEARLTRFYGAGIALSRNLRKYWCKWLTEPKSLNLQPMGKRIHMPCEECDPFSDKLVMGVWHKTICPVRGGESAEFPVQWINPNKEMSALDEFRVAENDWTDVL